MYGHPSQVGFWCLSFPICDIGPQIQREKSTEKANPVTDTKILTLSGEQMKNRGKALRAERLGSCPGLSVGDAEGKPSRSYTHREEVRGLAAHSAKTWNYPLIHTSGIGRWQ